MTKNGIFNTRSYGVGVGTRVKMLLGLGFGGWGLYLGWPPYWEGVWTFLLALLLLVWTRIHWMGPIIKGMKSDDERVQGPPDPPLADIFHPVHEVEVPAVVTDQAEGLLADAGDDPCDGAHPPGRAGDRGACDIRRPCPPSALRVRNLQPRRVSGYTRSPGGWGPLVDFGLGGSAYGPP